MGLLLISTAPFYVTLFWGLVLLLEWRTREQSRIVLGLFMLVASALYLTHAFFFLGYYHLYLKVDTLYMFTSLAVFPLFYCYVRLLVVDPRFSKVWLYHFVPALLFAFFMLLFRVQIGSQGLEQYLKLVLKGNNWQMWGISTPIERIVSLFCLSRLFFALQIFYYLIRGYLLVVRHDRRLSNFYSDSSGRKMGWLKVLILLFFVTSLSSFILNILGRGYFIDSHILLFVPASLFTILLFIIGYQGSRQRFSLQAFLDDVERESKPREAPPKAPISIETEVEEENMRKRLKDAILLLMENEMLYRSPDLRITTLCDLLSTNRTYVSGVINEEFGESFSAFVNRYRVEYAQRLIHKGVLNKHSLEYVAEESGFGSLSSFVRAFKQHLGVTPTNYFRSL